jgi:hypothetical protein
VQKDVHFPGVGHAVKLDVGEHPVTGKSFSFEWDVEGVADGGVGAVAGDQPGGFESFFADVLWTVQVTAVSV